MFLLNPLPCVVSSISPLLITSLNLPVNTLLDPIPHRIMPNQRILRIQNPMALVLKRQEPSRHAMAIQRMHRRNTVDYRAPVILLAVDDERGRRVLPLGHAFGSRGVELLERGVVDPWVYGAFEHAVVDDEVVLHVGGGDGVDAVVPDGAAELGVC